MTRCPTTCPTTPAPVRAPAPVPPPPPAALAAQAPHTKAPGTTLTTARELRHELGNFLTPALGRVQGLLRKLPEASTPGEREALESIQEGIARAVRLLDSAAVRRPSRCDLVALLASALAAMPADRFRDTQVRLAARVPLVGMWDEREIVQVLADVLRHATTHSPIGTPVTVTLDASPRPTRDAPSGYARVLVTDHGHDAPGRGVHRIFRGHRARRSHARSEGPVAGLQASQRRAETAGGRLSIERRGAATSLVLELPLSPPWTSAN